MPGRNGFQICRELRRSDIRTPILLLAVRDSVNDKVIGLKLGSEKLKGTGTFFFFHTENRTCPYFLRVFRIQAPLRDVPQYLAGRVHRLLPSNRTVPGCSRLPSGTNFVRLRYCFGFFICCSRAGFLHTGTPPRRSGRLRRFIESQILFLEFRESLHRICLRWRDLFPSRRAGFPRRWVWLWPARRGCDS